MPGRLKPTAPIAADAILVGDPGRALLLAQELLAEPKMSNHARGLWGYSGNRLDCRVDHRIRGSTRQSSGSGAALTIQSTGIGGPSAALVLGELAGLGVRRAVRVGTCVALDPELGPGELLVVGEALAAGGSATAQGAEVGEALRPAAALRRRLAAELGGEAKAATIASFDAYPSAASVADPATAPSSGAALADMQTAPLLARARGLGVEVAALTIVAETAGGETLGPEPLAECEKRAGRIAAASLSPST